MNKFEELIMEYVELNTYCDTSHWNMAKGKIKVKEIIIKNMHERLIGNWTQIDNYWIDSMILPPEINDFRFECGSDCRLMLSPMQISITTEKNKDISDIILLYNNQDYIGLGDKVIDDKKKFEIMMRKGIDIDKKLDMIHFMSYHEFLGRFVERMLSWHENSRIIRYY